MNIEITDTTVPIHIPFTLVPKEGNIIVFADNLAMTSEGTKATTDGEYAKAVPCAGKLIDGIIPDPEDFLNKRWHSSIETHTLIGSKSNSPRLNQDRLWQKNLQKINHIFTGCAIFLRIVFLKRNLRRYLK